MSEQDSISTGTHLRRLLPGPNPQPSIPSLAPVKQVYVKGACDACRKHKAKCSGERPRCIRCNRLNIRCIYSRNLGESPSQALRRAHHNLQGRSAAYEELFELLRNLPEQEAQSVFQKIRSGTDPATIVNQVQTGSLLLQLAVSPETRFRYEFPYRSEMPKDYVFSNPYLKSLIYEAASLHSPVQNSESLDQDSKSVYYQSLYLKPFHAARTDDERLLDIRPSLWTAVCSDDVLMRDLLGVFLRCEYHFTSAFQKDYFLEDMAAKRTDFCSSLLVNITLAYACVCYPRFEDRAEYWNPRTLTYRFLAEAKRIWELVGTEPHITTIQAGMLFSVFHNLAGLDEIGQAYRIRAVELAHALHLFDRSVDQESKRIQNGKAYTAWALYCWETLSSFSFMIPPLLVEPPQQPLPDISEEPEWYGEIHLRYPLDKNRLPSSFAHVFKARSHFRVIMNQFCHAAYSGPGVSLSKACELLSQLEAWYDALPGPLTPRKIVLPAHLQLHMYYHYLLISLYEPFLDAETNQAPAPKEIVAEAGRNLQTLIRLYYLRHGFEAMDLFIVIPLVFSGFQCIKSIDDQTPIEKLETLRSTLILITKGLHSQRRNHYLAEALFRVIRGLMRPQEAALLKGTINYDENEANEKQAVVQNVRSKWPVSPVRKKEDVESHILNNLVENYAHLNVKEDEAVQPSQ